LSALAGLHQQAETLARAITDPDSQARALITVAATLAQAGETRRASRVTAGACVAARWTSIVRLVFLLAPSAFTTLAPTLAEQ
jgi:hypothetical protein